MPEHLSLYILEVYPHLPLKQEIDRHGWTQLPDDAAAEMYESAMARLDAAGYEQYEISNVCRAGRRIAAQPEVLDRWRMAGLRSRGAFHVGRRRWRNVASTEDYTHRIGGGESVVVDRRTLTNDERLGDALFTGLRLNRGVDVDLLSMRYGD